MEQRSAAWHEMRRKYIGASDAAAILGVSPWKTSYDLWVEKTSPTNSEIQPNEWMQRGIDLEDEALRAFEKATGYLMSPYVLVSPRNQFMMASLDGFEIEGKAAVEIKCPGNKDHEYALSGKIPEKYIPQLQHQIEVTGLDKVYYCSYSPDHVKPLYIKEVYRDDEYISNLVKRETEFYYDHMLTGIAPKKSEKFKNMDCQKWANLIEEHKAYDLIEKDAANRKEEIKKQMVELSGEENAKGNGFILQKIERKGFIDYQKIPMLKTMNLEEFRKPSTSFWQVKESND